ncbi:MAG: AAA family ATPase, partial [Spirochaetes bacterium]|nr:AAA family ATPase [Spirochaetota bacterium]
MIEIKGLRLTEKLYESEKTLVYRALRESDGAKVIVKTNKSDNPDPADVGRLQNEYNVVSGFNSRRIIKFHSLVDLGNKKAIIMEDAGGISLDQYMSEKKFPLPEILKISSELSDCIGEIHRNKIVHNNINPSNIIINTGSGEIKIIDFGIASDIGREIRSAVSPEIIEGSLAYVSPEQTGRMNRSIDYRTDFYSLGVLFYRLLTGRLPFETTDAMELVHSHIAILPVPPFRLREDIPRIFSDIIMKLLAKNAEERYQSANGLKTDLDKCIEKLDSAGKIKNFDLGASDVSEVLRIPEKIYGRKNEILRLSELFYEVAGGSKKTVLISGPPGIGKSFLVNEIQKPLLRERGYFISGKFDRLKRDIPYNSFTQALKALVKQILTESEERIRIWKEELSENLGENTS